MNHPSRIFPKVIGADIEFGNWLEPGDPMSESGTGEAASRMLLAACPGLSSDLPVTTDFNPLDWGRKWQPATGGCVYIDSHHLEVCAPEVLRATSHVAAVKAMFRFAERARDLCHQTSAAGPSRTLRLSADNSDRLGNSYGSHLNIAITRSAFHSLFSARCDLLPWFASYLATAQIFTGQGKVGAENGAEPCSFQISVRADFFRKLCGLDTMGTKRPLVNCRNEPLGDDPCARLHVIFFDNSLTDHSIFLRAGVTQIMAAMVEADAVNPARLLRDPVRAAHDVSRDLTLGHPIDTLAGGRTTALELQMGLADDAEAFIAGGGCAGLVPEAAAILRAWREALAALDRRDWSLLARRLDWVAKWQFLERVRAERKLSWDDHGLRLLDLAWGRLPDGIFRRLESAGLVDRLVPESEVQRCLREPPEPDTRAAARARVLSALDPDDISSVNWHRIVLRRTENRSTKLIVVSMPFPDSTTTMVGAAPEPRPLAARTKP